MNSILMKLEVKSFPFNLLFYSQKAGIAQLVEQRTENPRVTSSSLVPGISKKEK
jgi:hypothetical protein